ncbi:prolyl oligopeptidase family serine peptidase [Nannocystis radixulma]|uniref:Prolyl oligopeptidase family serine peptidase n=1 Tax=Nannocystis radixulma TaxID=2995305 RepID=A0ABT5B4V4_9BACT|nr:prolyl oligopeptidase family serine peptidase [Nannocystis radixulma]MDC0668137.1 prolyl oligopeptidase family serine peptidase [Nannocystis radixulma]
MLRVAALVLGLAAAPPVARTVDEVVVTLHGEPHRDEYAWLKAGPDDPAVRAHLDAENRHAEALLRPQRALMRALEREIEAIAYVDDESAPVRRGEWLYWTRQRRHDEHPTYLRRRVDAPEDQAPQVILDLQRLARGRDFLDLGVFEVASDGRALAYSLDEVGGENYTLFIKNLETGVERPERIDRVTSAAWSADGRELVYTVRDDTYRSFALRGRTLGGDDRLIYEEADPRFDIYVERSRSGEWLIARSSSATTSEVRVARAATPAGPWTVVADRVPGHLYDVDHAGDEFYIRSNRGAPHFRVVAAPEDDPAPAGWREVVGERPGVALAHLDAFDRYLVLLQRERGFPRLVFVDRATGATVRAGQAERRRGLSPRTGEIVDISPGDNPDPAATHYRVHLTTVHAPDDTVDLAFADGSETLVHRRPPPAACGRKAGAFAAARANDGTEILYMYFAGTGPHDGPRPILLEAYGSYGFAWDPDFDAARCTLMNRGVDFVIAWVRGGGELGEPWHEAGRRRFRSNAVDDLLAVAAHLIDRGYTTRDLLAVAGDSAGGALVASALNRRPELFRAAVLRVPFLDAVGTMADPTAPLTTTEYEEWGDPAVRADYDVIRGWCPYANLGPRAYPALLVESSLADARVAYHEQARYVARQRRLASGGGPTLLRTETHAGHAGPSSRRAWLLGRAFEAAFLLAQLGRAGR